MHSAYRLWQEGDPRWLLQASRSCFASGKYPDAINQWINQCVYNELPDIADRDFLEKIHPSHKELIGYLAKESEAYYKVFYDTQIRPYDSYTQELVTQYNQAYGPQKKMDLKSYQIHERPYIINNLMAAVAVATIRDLSIVDALHRDEHFNEDEHKSALAHINARMNRLGINGIDRLFESKPELEEFIKQDTRIIDTKHIQRVDFRAEKTRAATYNVGILEMGAAKDSDLLTKLRQDIIHPHFGKLQGEKDRYLLVHTNDVSAEPSEEARNKYKGYGVTTAHGTAEDEARNLALLRKLRVLPASELEEYLDFLIYDGIAINAGNPEQNAHRIRAEFNNIVHDGSPDLNVVNSSIPKIESKNKEPGKKDNHKSPSPDDIIEGQFRVVDTKASSARTSTDDSASTNKDGKESSPPHSSDRSYDTGAKFAALAGAGALAGLAVLGHGKRSHDSDSKKDNDSNKSGLLKPLAFAVATSVTVGGAIMWSRKPSFLYKPLRELLDKMLRGPGNIR